MNEDVVAAIKRRAKELADEAPQLTSEQAYLLASLFSRGSDRGAA